MYIYLRHRIWGYRIFSFQKDTFAHIAPHIETAPYMEITDGSGKQLTPGLIDRHVHVSGGGGEGGFATRTPEIQLSALIQAGITTVVGLLGTDGVTRSVEDLIAKVKALKSEGISAYAMTGPMLIRVRQLQAQ